MIINKKIIMKKRNTKQKEIILQAVRSSCIHPTAEEVYLEVNKIDPKISVSTVYRNLQEMAEDGLIEKLIDKFGINRFDGMNCKHYHFVCTNCDKIFDLGIPYNEDINSLVKKHHVDCHSIVFRGICNDCHNHKLKGEK